MYHMGLQNQRLTPEDEDSIKSCVSEIQAWGFPPIAQLRDLDGKREKNPLGKIGFEFLSPCNVTSQIQLVRSRSFASLKSKIGLIYIKEK